MSSNPKVELLNSAEVCALLSIDRSTLSRWVKDGTLPCYTKLPGLRGAFLFDRSAVEALANAKKGAS